MQYCSLNKRIQSILALFVMLFTMQMSIPVLALTFIDDHNISLKRQNGDIYIVLGHNDHDHHHLHHAHKHSHKDHFIKLPKSSEITSIVNAQIDTEHDNQINFAHYHIEQKQNFQSFLADTHRLNPSRYWYYEAKPRLLELKNIIQFLV